VRSTRAAARGWLALVLLPAATLLLVPADWPRWTLMWALAAALFAGVKWLTWRQRPPSAAPGWLHAAYLVAWPGLDAAGFLGPRDATPAPPREWLAASAKLALGMAVLVGGTRLAAAAPPYLVGWIGMIGLVMVLHFGAFHLISCAWRGAGVRARPLMSRPLAATSVTDFWGRRWNTAFRDLTHRFLFRPLARGLGPRTAILAGFAFSGLVHDLVISVPARGGYGGPTAFFALQGLAILAERSRPGQRLGLGHGRRGWAFTMLVLALPVCGLFHPPFVLGIVLPFLRDVGIS
jgi:hypothetical protein